MARQKRLNLSSAIYHVITRGLNGAALFKDCADRDEFLRRLALALSKTSCRCYGWALMGNHRGNTRGGQSCILLIFVVPLYSPSPPSLH